MTSRPAPTTRPGHDEPAESAVVCDDRAALQALEAACQLHEGPVTVTELLWAWAADRWWDAATDPTPTVDPTTIPHSPNRADLARVRRRLTALHHRSGWSAPGTRHPGSRSNRPTLLDCSEPVDRST